MRIVDLSGVGVLVKLIPGPHFSQTNAIRIFTIIEMQQFVRKSLQNPEKVLDGFRVIPYNFDCLTRLNLPERLCDSQEGHRDYHTP